MKKNPQAIKQEGYLFLTKKLIKLLQLQKQI